MRLAASIGKGGGGGFLLGGGIGIGLRDSTGGGDGALELLAAGGGVSSLVPANKSKSPKSLMAALGAEQENSANPGVSGGDVETGASFSCVAFWSRVFVDAAMLRAT